jgi:acetyl-CoA synthetase
MNDTNLLEHQPIAWTPTADVIERAQLTKFMRQIGVHSFDELYRYSIENVEEFTHEVLKFLDIKFDLPYEKLLDTANGIEFPNWCAGAGLNITEMCLDRWQTDEMKAYPAIILEDEEGETQTVGYADLIEEIKECATGLRAFGFGRGDTVGIYLPMMIETVVALLAIGRIGAIAVPVFSGYGVEAIASRMNAVGAKALITCDGFPRRGKIFSSFEIAEQAVANCPTIEKLFVVNRLEKEFTNENPKVENWFDLMNQGIKPWNQYLTGIAKTKAEDPLIILYTSGTTGKPKGILHTHCGFPIKAAQDMAFGTDVGKGTRISWITDLGWMMGPWLIYGALINGATMVLYDGAPDFPNADRMWEFCAKHKVEVLGISPTLIRALSRNADRSVRNTEASGNASFAVSGDADRSVRAPFQKHDLSALRAFASTGEPWNPAPWWWLFEKVGDSKLPIINYSGGTEISGGILMGNPLLPIKPCSFPAPCLGIDVGILDENGSPVEKGNVGELAIRQPWIGMARGFWQEPERYLETYWSRFKDIWVHGDWAMQDADRHFYILGRSDDTLKVAGKRVGPAEVESLLVAHEAVTEAAVIGVPDEMKGTAMIAFCVLKERSAERENNAETQSEISLSANKEADLKSALRELVAKDMGKPLAPSKIHFVDALPKTRNGKVMRRVIRSAYLGEDAGDLSALENLDCVEEIRGKSS